MNPSAVQSLEKPSLNRKVLGVGSALALALVLLLLLSLKRDPGQVRSPLIGRPAPAFALPPAGGGAPISLTGLRGKPAVLNFWATWCVPCYEEHEVLSQAAQELGPSVHFLGIVYEDEEEAVLDFLRKQGSAYPSLLDGEGKTAIAYGVYGVPETFFLDPQGTVVAKYMGPLTQQQLRAHIEKAGGSRP